MIFFIRFSFWRRLFIRVLWCMIWYVLKDISTRISTKISWCFLHLLIISFYLFFTGDLIRVIFEDSSISWFFKISYGCYLFIIHTFKYSACVEDFFKYSIGWSFFNNNLARWSSFANFTPWDFFIISSGSNFFIKFIGWWLIKWSFIYWDLPFKGHYWGWFHYFFTRSCWWRFFYYAWVYSPIFQNLDQSLKFLNDLLLYIFFKNWIRFLIPNLNS